MRVANKCDRLLLIVLLLVAIVGCGRTEPDESSPEKIEQAAAASRHREEGLAAPSKETKEGVDQAITCFTEAIRIKPDDYQAYYNRGIAYARNGRLEKTFADYAEALRINPQSPETHYYLGVAHMRTQEFDKAKAAFTEAIRLKPDDVKSFTQRGVAYARGFAFEHAINDFTEAIRIDPEYAAGYQFRGQIFRDTGKRTEGEADLKKADSLGFVGWGGEDWIIRGKTKGTVIQLTPVPTH